MAARVASSTHGSRSLRASLARTLTIGLFIVFVLVPLYWVVITSIKPSSDYLTTPPVWFPAKPTIVHYTAALFSYRGLQGLINSLIVASASTVLSTVMGTMMAYSLARFNTGGRHLALWVISQRFLPPVASRSDGRLCAIRASSSSTSPCRTWTRSFATRCAARSSVSTRRSRRR
jgi:ABC-type glycerol-3-phosphate transport system permease component